MSQYERKFFELIPYVDYMKDDKFLVNHFIRGLNVRITRPICMEAPGSLQVAIEKTLLA